MNRPLAFRAAALAAILAAAPAFADGPEPQVIPADQLTPTVKGKLQALREKINTELASDPAAQGKALAMVKAAEKEFFLRIDVVKDKTNYTIEARYLAEAFERLVIAPANEAIVVMRSRGDMDVKIAAMARIRQDAVRKEENFQTQFYRANKEEIDAIVQKRIDDFHHFGRRPGGFGKRIAADVTARDVDMPPGMAKFERFSPLIRIGKDSFLAAGNPGGGAPNTGGTVPNTGGGAPNTGGTVPNTGGDGALNPGDGNGASPNGGTSGPSWSDIAQHGVDDAPQAITAAAGQALNNGDYGQALELSSLALQFDPKNKDAQGVFQSVKGREGGLEAGAASWSAAKGGASAFGVGSDGGGGPSGSASFSPGIGAGANAGALRAAAEQAMGAARSAQKLDPEGALEIMTKALAQDPANPALLNLRAQIYGRLGRWEEALKDATAGLALVPGNMALLNTKALAENRTHRYREALATSELMIATDPRNAWGYANRAHAWGGLGNKDAMMSDINRAAKLDPRFLPVAAAAAALQLPSEDDVIFLFPGEAGKGAKTAPAAAVPERGRSFGVLAGAALVGGLLLALGLLSVVLEPIKQSVASVFTKSTRREPAVATPEPASVAGNVGSLIRGQYEIARQIGAGGMGMVYEGTDRSLGRRVAIKKMRDELRVNVRERDRFIIEAKTVASLHHPNIVDIFAIAQEGDDVYLVFEYVDGKTAHDLVQAKGRLDPAETARVTRGIGEALTYAHSRGVIHRDMKPSNVMLTADGRVKVMDFGIARMAKDALTRYSMTNTVVGTPPYMAPEQEQGVVRKESDVYSLAICAYEMLTGKLPFIGMGAGMLMNKINMSYIPPSRAIAGLSEAFDEVFLKAFQADPERRYRTPAEFTAALSAAAGGSRGALKS